MKGVAGEGRVKGVAGEGRVKGVAGEGRVKGAARERAVGREAKLATKNTQDLCGNSRRRTALALARGFRQFASVLEVVKAEPCSPCSSRRACT